MAGSCLATVGIIGTTSAKKASSDPLDNIDSKVLEAYNDHGEDGLHEVMEDSGYNYVVSTTTETLESENDSEFSPQAHYKKPTANFLINAFNDPKGEERIRVQVITTLDVAVISPGFGTWADDVITITYDGNEWTNVGESSLRTSPSEDSSIELYPDSISNGGVGALVDLEKIYPDASQSVLLAQSLNNLNGNPGTIYGSYVHAWSANPTSVTVDSIEGGAGPASVSFGGILEGDWQITDDESTDDLI
ncbi:hypothetical protein SAMN04489841_2182 [Natrinema salaciae]|uniref:Uncharacterized protein n=2 Tax=Natrinema salaciae TaxID=1186196 RepID=A0A1H9ICB3_9EURY|nr:hypothetical protein SAMN04489841_2182 [Natrinema salaciae]